jgi:putative redox protein
MAEDTATISVRHLGEDRLAISVRGHALTADQPLGGGGEDTAPTPTELFVASLAACVAFYAERFLRRHGLETEGLVVACDYAWARDPARVGQIDVRLEAPGLTPDRYEAFARVVQHCPIHTTLLQPPEVRFQVVAANTMSAA